MVRQPLPRGLKQAIERLDAQPERAWRLRELSEIGGVAPRTLQKHFRRFLGHTPRAFLQQLRLERARRDLLGGYAQASVTQIATRCGFTHLGRFAADYHQRYGESPSATLRHSRRGSAASIIAAPVLSAALERPTIALIPLERAGQALNVAMEIEDEIACALWRLHWLKITAPRYARYHLRATVHDDGARLRVTTRLIDAGTGGHVWAAAFDGERHDPIAFAERLALAVARAVGPTLHAAEVERASRGDRSELTAWQLSMRALPFVTSIEATAEKMALEMLEKAMERAPHDPLPFAMAAWCRGLRSGHHFTTRPDAEKAAARELAAKAARLGVGDAQTASLLAAGYTVAHDLEAAAVHSKRALALDGSSAWAWGRNAWVLAYLGHAAEAIEQFQIARSLAPADPLNFLWSVGIAAAEFQLARYSHSIRWYERAFAENPASIWTKRFLAPAYVLADRMEEAKHTFSEFEGAFRDLTISDIRSGLPWNASYMDRVSEGLEHLGMRS